MRLNKIIVGASAFAMAAALSAGVGSADADASTISDKSVVFNLSSSVLSITAGDNNKISVSYPTVSKTGVLGADKNVCTYDVKDGSVSVNLSTLNVTKDNYIKISGDRAADPVIYKIPAADQLGKATVSATDGAISVPKKGTTANYDTAKLEFATTSSDWWSMDDANFSDFLQLGATIRVRVAGTDKATVEKATSLADKAKKEYVTYNVEGNLPGKEIKAKIKAMANAPKVKIDYNKRTITVPAKAEYRINKSDAFDSWSNAWVKCTSKTDLKNGTIDLYKDGIVDVRVSETTTKPASKYAVVSWKAIYGIGAKAATANSNGNVETTLVASGSAVAENTAATGGAVTLKAEVTKAVLDSKDKVKTATSTAITVENKSKIYKYQIVAVDNDTKMSFDAKVKGAKAVNCDKTASIKVICPKSGEFTDKDIYVRRVAVTKGDCEFVTDWSKVMTVTKKAGIVTVIEAAHED